MWDKWHQWPRHGIIILSEYVHQYPKAHSQEKAFCQWNLCSYRTWVMPAGVQQVVEPIHSAGVDGRIRKIFSWSSVLKILQYNSIGQISSGKRSSYFLNFCLRDFLSIFYWTWKTRKIACALFKHRDRHMDLYSLLCCNYSFKLGISVLNITFILFQGIIFHVSYKFDPIFW